MTTPIPAIERLRKDLAQCHWNHWFMSELSPEDAEAILAEIDRLTAEVARLRKVLLDGLTLATPNPGARQADPHQLLNEIASLLREKT